jgi:hypothetical protein
LIRCPTLDQMEYEDLLVIMGELKRFLRRGGRPGVKQRERSSVLSATKTKKSALAIGRKRGVPMRLVRAIARHYDLDKIVVWTADQSGSPASAS